MNKFIDPNHTALKFVLVGVVNTIFGTSIMFILYNICNFSYWISTFANYFFGSILSYFLNCYFTFNAKQYTSKSVIKFIINIVFCYITAYGIAKPLVRYLLSRQSVPIQDNVSMLVGMGLFTIINYIGQRYFVFSGK